MTANATIRRKKLIEVALPLEAINVASTRELIQIATEGNPPPLLDPFAGGGSISSPSPTAASAMP